MSPEHFVSVLIYIAQHPAGTHKLPGKRKGWGDGGKEEGGRREITPLSLPCLRRRGQIARSFRRGLSPPRHSGRHERSRDPSRRRVERRCRKRLVYGKINGRFPGHLRDIARQSHAAHEEFITSETSSDHALEETTARARAYFRKGETHILFRQRHEMLLRVAPNCLRLSFALVIDRAASSCRLRGSLSDRRNAVISARRPWHD